jgi:putative transcription factor
MAECEVCGKESAGKRAEIDGVILSVCDDCAKLGKEVCQPRKVFIPSSPASRAPRPESIEDEKELSSDFSARTRHAREKANLTQDEAAMKMGISHQIYKRIESGFKPDEATARKIERFYGISLYQQTQ